EEFAANELLRGDVRDLLKGINDIERLVSRAAAGLANARDLIGLKDSLARLSPLCDAIGRCSSETVCEILARLGRHQNPLKEPFEVRESQTAEVVTPSYCAPVHSYTEISALISRALVDEPSAGLRDGGMIREGFSAELDALRTAATEEI